MTTFIGRTSELGPVVDKLNGKIVFPDHASWAEARLAWNLAVDQKPAAVAYPESVDDVGATIRLAKALELRVAAQGTGHNAAPLGPLEDTILVKTERLPRIEIDPSSRIARVAGFVADHDHLVTEGLRFVQLPPPGSACSIAIGTGLTGSEPGSAQLQLVVADVAAVRAELQARGRDIGDVQTFDWGSFVFFTDPDGNR